MKSFLLIAFTFTSTFLLAQATSSAPYHTQTKHGTMTVRKPYVAEVIQEREVYKVVDQMPVFPGGQQALMWYLSTVPYPIDMRNTGVGGKVYVEFIIEADGKVISPVVLNRSFPKSGQDVVINHIKNMPRWQPGRQRGQAVAVQMVATIFFKTN